jgi:carbon-monoxide dehydrogenase medium subunit
MRPASFDYFSPQTLEEAMGLIGENSRPLAGGQSLIALMNLRFATPESLVDLQGIPDLAVISEDSEFVRIGAMVSQADTETNSIVLESAPLVAEGIREIGHWQIRTRGTIGGNLAHSDPASELPAVMVALGAHYHLVSKRGEREIPATDFHQGAFDTILDADEILTAISVPKQKSTQQSALKETVRAAGAYAIAGVTTIFETENQTFVGGKLVLFGTGSRPYEVKGLIDVLGGEALNPSSFKRAAELVESQAPLFDDFHATAEQRKQIFAALSARVLEETWGKFEIGTS